jgi:hypothetical protein
MSRLFVVTIFVVFCNLTAISQQSKSARLSKKFKNADSIILLSHALVEGSTDEVIGRNGKRVSLPSLFIDGKLNRQVVKQQVLLTGRQVDTLVSILAARSKAVTSQGGCFTPHHAIIISSKTETSYIDLCFHCLSFRASADIDEHLTLHKRSWKRLENYFIAQGLTYGL